MADSSSKSTNLSRFQTFYTNTLLSPSGCIQEDIFIYPAIKKLLLHVQTNGITEALPQKAFLSTIHAQEIASVLQFYWSLHNATYIQRLHSLLKQITGDIRTKTPKAIIIVPAMNELNITRAIRTAKSDYGEAFDKDVIVIVYHNYKEEPDNKIKDVIMQLKEISNVFVINEKVSQYNTCSMAKKVGTDLAQLLLEDTADIPFILMDADLVDLTTGTIQATIETLQKKDVLATAPGYDFDTKIKVKFPVIGTIWEIDKEMSKLLLQNGLRIKCTLGGFTGISRKILAIIGGIKVVTNDLQESVIDDAQLSKDLFHVIGYDIYGYLDRWSSNPISPIKNYEYIAYFDASREIQDIAQGNPFDIRWKNSLYYDQISGTKRPSMVDKKNYTKIPELGKMNSENLSRALNNYREYMYDRDFYYEHGNVISKLFLKTLDTLGFKTTFSAIKTSEMEEGFPLEDTSLSFDLILNTDDWKIAEFKTVEKQ